MICLLGAKGTNLDKFRVIKAMLVKFEVISTNMVIYMTMLASGTLFLPYMAMSS